jgi:hypothetical protein
MFYPKHQIRSYCLYLGSFQFEDDKLDMGVYEHPDGRVSHAIVFGEEDDEYLSGEFDPDSPCESEWPGVKSKINKLLYQRHRDILRTKAEKHNKN